MAGNGKRPFWLHQLADYVVAGLLLVSGLRASAPIVPVAFAAVVALNAACVDGPLAAFRGLSRRGHRSVDIVVGVGLVAAQFVHDVGARWPMAGAALVLAFVALNTSYTKRPSRTERRATAAAAAERAPRTGIGEPSGKPGGGRSEEIGRTAGRVAGAGIRAYRHHRSGGP